MSILLASPHYLNVMPQWCGKLCETVLLVCSQLNDLPGGDPGRATIGTRSRPDPNQGRLSVCLPVCPSWPSRGLPPPWATSSSTWRLCSWLRTAASPAGCCGERPRRNRTARCSTGPLLLGPSQTTDPSERDPALVAEAARENELSMSKPLHFETSYFTLFILRRVDAMPPQLCTKAVVRLSFPRTELLECLGDTDFLAKLHCVRQACQVRHAH